MPGTGRESQIGFGEEVTPGTQVVASRFFEYLKESLKFDVERIESAGMRAGRKTQNLWVPGRKGATGDVELEVQPNGFGVIPKYMLGGTPVTTTPAGGTLARLHTTKVGNLDGKALTVQVGRPNIAGGIDAFTYRGCKVNNWELDMEVGGILHLKVSLDAVDEDTATALAAANYPAANVMLPWADASVSILLGGTAYPCRKITLSGDNQVKGDRYKLGQPTKLEQLEGTSFREYKGTIELESYQGLAPYNLFRNGTEAAIVATFTGAIIEGALPYMVRLTLARCRFDGETPNVDGPDILNQSMPFVALWSAAASTEVMLEVQNTDATA